MFKNSMRVSYAMQYFMQHQEEVNNVDKCCIHIMVFLAGFVLSEKVFIFYKCAYISKLLSELVHQTWLCGYICYYFIYK